MDDNAIQIGKGMKCGWECNAELNRDEMWLGMQCRLEWDEMWMGMQCILEWGCNVDGNAIQTRMGIKRGWEWNADWNGGEMWIGMQCRLEWG